MSKEAQVEQEATLERLPAVPPGDVDALKALFKIALEKRDFEITQLVQRNNFFMIFQGVLFAGVMQSSHTKPVVTLLVCIAGLLISLFQVGMASGAKFWQEYWEEALKKIEGRLLLHIHRTDDSRREIWSLFHDRTAIYDEIVNRRLHSHNKSFMSITSWLVAKRFSVSRIPIYVGLSLSIIWAVMVFIAVDIDFTGINIQVKGFN
ncbi:hypothetical protein AN391_00971 [Pseudoalteromonas sp. P1-13-1a]|uniref:Uncharacterized protein n=1 Tax=Pseudoalteromonas undina TaxID=43660 RepID=A0ACC6R869_9GAMM|nr:hypothetical protein [Pseudoalteromonas sp. P1-13-1a]KPZ59633.1 hypothetical protein AN391_00971 [Pseudoalteromonas sp. P1-13-1a]